MTAFSTILLLFLSYGYIKLIDGGRKTVTTKETVGTETRIMTSPNYPNPYGNVLTYEWYLTVNSSIPDGILQFRVLDCRIRDATPCYEEAITIYNGPSEWYPTLNSWCGYKYPAGVFSSTRSATYVVFTSGAQYHTNPGFRIMYWAKSKPPKPLKEIKFTWLNYALFGIFVSVVFIVLFTMGTIHLLHKCRTSSVVDFEHLAT